MDLGKLDTRSAADEGAFLHLRHPKTDAPLHDEATGEPVGITLLGKDSSVYRSIERSQANRRLERLGRTGGAPLTADEIEANTLELLVGCTKNLHHIVLGEPLTFSPANAKKLYTAGPPWIREQVDVFIGTRANFLGDRKSVV